MTTSASNKTEVFEIRPGNFNALLEVSAIYVNLHGKCLLLKNGPDKKEGGFFGVPAGKLELNETSLTGAHRELFEETGIHAEQGSLEPVGKLYLRKPGLDYVYHLFELKLNVIPEVQLSKEHQNHTWATFTEAEELPLMQGAKEALQYYFAESEKLGKKSNHQFNFGPVQASHRSLVHSWLVSPQAAEWFYGDGLQNTYRHLDDFLAGGTFSKYWIAFDQEHPFAFFITSDVDKPKDPLSRWCKEEGRTITLDMLIGDTNYIGKGFASPLIKAFLDSAFPDVQEVLIDPEASNTRAVHVYQKAGFVILEEFIPKHSHNPHLMMRLNR